MSPNPLRRECKLVNDPTRMPARPYGFVTFKYREVRTPTLLLSLLCIRTLRPHVSRLAPEYARLSDEHACAFVWSLCVRSALSIADHIGLLIGAATETETRRRRRLRRNPRDFLSDTHTDALCHRFRTRAPRSYCYSPVARVVARSSTQGTHTHTHTHTHSTRVRFKCPTIRRTRNCAIRCADCISQCARHQAHNQKPSSAPHARRQAPRWPPIRRPARAPSPSYRLRLRCSTQRSTRSTWVQCFACCSPAVLCSEFWALLGDSLFLWPLARCFAHGRAGCRAVDRRGEARGRVSCARELGGTRRLSQYVNTRSPRTDRTRLVECSLIIERLISSRCFCLFPLASRCSGHLSHERLAFRLRRPLAQLLLAVVAPPFTLP